jgi:hypothetical protein
MSSIVIAGDTSGSVTLQAPAVAGSTVLNLPATSGTIQASGAGYTTNGVAYATSATGLATGSALVFDGTNLGIGITPTIKLDVSSTASRILNLNSTSANGYGMAFNNSGTDVAYIGSAKWNFSGALNDMSITTAGAYNLCFGTNTTERARITSGGSFGIGETSPSSARLYVTSDGSALDTVYVKNSNTASGTNNSVVFVRGASSVVGTIQTTLTTTAYNTSSDYRLKEDIAPMVGALAKVTALKPVTYKWKLDGSAGQGFIAHELQEVVPECVSGEKDAMDADGNPKYQGIDTSFLVATLTAAIQEQQALITTLTERITALEGA